MNADATNVAAMRRAIALSALGLGTTSPNPPVGCVILDRAGHPVGEGYHRRKGESHAEVHALAAAGSHAAGGTAVVTLEPCNHHGRTPPCHQALIDAGIRRVLIAVIDPTSRGVGGVARLREAGIDVEVGLLAEEALVVLGPWLAALMTGRPRVIWACDTTSGDPQPVPTEVVEHAVLRCQVDAVLHPDGQVEEGIPHAHGKDAFELPPRVPVAEPTTALSLLHKAGARTVLLHGGVTTAAPFMKRQLIDELRIFLSKSISPPQVAPSRERSLELHLAGFRIDTVRRLRSGVLIEASSLAPEPD